MIVIHINYNSRIFSERWTHPLNTLFYNRMLIGKSIHSSVHFNSKTNIISILKNIVSFNMIGNKVAKYDSGLVTGQKQVCQIIQNIEVLKCKNNKQLVLQQVRSNSSFLKKPSFPFLKKSFNIFKNSLLIISNSCRFASDNVTVKFSTNGFKTYVAW